MLCSLMTEKRKEKFILLILFFCQQSNKALEESRHIGCAMREFLRNGVMVSTYLWQHSNCGQPDFSGMLTLSPQSSLHKISPLPLYHSRKLKFFCLAFRAPMLLPKVALSSPPWNSWVSPKQVMNFRQRRSIWKGN